MVALVPGAVQRYVGVYGTGDSVVECSVMQAAGGNQSAAGPPGRDPVQSGTMRLYPAGDPVALREAAEVVRWGGLVVYPTDTLYGLGTNALDPAAVDRLLGVKGRSAARGLPVLLADPAAATALVAEWPAGGSGPRRSLLAGRVDARAATRGASAGPGRGRHHGRLADAGSSGYAGADP